MDRTKPILCLDFDGVCHGYTSGWQGITVIPDQPVAGLFAFLENANKYFDLYIYSSRSSEDEGRQAMRRWFVEHGTKAGYTGYVGGNGRMWAVDLDEIEAPNA